MFYNEEMEKAVVGALLCETAACEALGALRPEMFYIEKYRLIYEGIVSAYGAGKPVDILVVAEDMRALGTLERAGGPYAVAEASSTVYSAAHLRHHVLVLYEYYVRRELWKSLSACVAACGDMGADVFDLILGLQSSLEGLLDNSPVQEHLKHAGEVAALTMERIRRRAETGSSGLTGIPTGIPRLDELTGGWQPGNLILTAARPGQGKTQLDLRFAQTAASAGFTTLFFTLEMMGTEVGERILLNGSGLDYRLVKRGLVTEADMQALEGRAAEVGALPLYVDDTPYIGVDQLCSIAKSLKAKKGLGLVVVDYLQLLGTASRQGRTREQEVAECTRKLKSLARLLECPVIVSSQLNRQVENTYDHRPELRHLRESGAIEQDADLVLMLYSPEGSDGSGRELIVAKNRHGEITKPKGGIAF